MLALSYVRIALTLQNGTIVLRAEQEPDSMARVFINTVLAINTGRGERPRPSGAGNHRTEHCWRSGGPAGRVPSVFGRVRASPLALCYAARRSAPPRTAAQYEPVRARVVYDRESVDLVRLGADGYQHGRRGGGTQDKDDKHHRGAERLHQDCHCFAPSMHFIYLFKVHFEPTIIFQHLTFC